MQGLARPRAVAAAPRPTCWRSERPAAAVPLGGRARGGAGVATLLEERFHNAGLDLHPAQERASKPILLRLSGESRRFCWFRVGEFAGGDNAGHFAAQRVVVLVHRITDGDAQASAK